MRRVASLCTIPGREAGLEQTLRSLLPQVDALHVHFNATTQGEAWRTVQAMDLDALNPQGVAFSISGSPTNRGDAMKFLGLPSYMTGVCRLICDDDIIYPPDYADRMERAAWQHQGPVSAQGSILLRPFKGYYESRRTLGCTAPIGEELVDVPGTGCLAYLSRADTRFMPRHFPVTNMADIWAAIAFRQRGLQVKTVAHPGGWLRLADPTNEQTIWHASKRRDGSVMDRGAAMTEALLGHRDLFDI